MLPFPKKVFLTVLFSTPFFCLQAQIEVTPADVPPFTPENLITNIFLGEGLEVLNITYSGLPSAVGYFSNGSNDMGIDRGIVMSSGNVSSVATANTSGSTSGSTSGNTYPDPDLSAIANANIFDVARYEISFIPISDTLRFRFVFASEEYPEYACTNFNDAFGFFISGPGINGAFSNNGENIALVPDPSDPTGLTFTDVPVTINNVNNEGVDVAGGCLFDYSMYYNDNAGSLTMTYDAYLDVFTAQAVVIPCSTYTIKLAICDRGDSVFDSAVFLEAKSFGTGSLDVQVATVSLDGTITEECSGAEISFCLPTPTEADFLIDYNLVGTAEPGVDFPAFPDTLLIPAGDSCVSLFVDAFEDGLLEGVESLGIDIQRDPCNRDTFWVYIRDNELIAPDLGPDTTICKGESVQLDGTLPIQLPDPPSFTNDVPVSFSSGNAPQFSDINVFGVQPFFLNAEVIQSVCIDKLMHPWMDDVDLYLISPGGQFVELSTDNGADGGNLSYPDSMVNTCFTTDALTPVNFPGPFAPPSALPLTGNWQPEGVWSDLWDGDNPVNGTWRLQLFDDTPGFSGTLESWTITFEPVYQINYQWTPVTGLSCADCPDPVATPDTTTTYYLEASDSYGCSVFDTITIEVLDVLPPPQTSCELFSDTSILVSWPAMTSATSYEINIDNAGWLPVTTGLDTLTYLIEGLTYDQCVDIQVRAVALCNGLIDSLTCCTPSCTPGTFTVVDVQNTSCFGGSDGSILVAATGQNPPFTYTLPALGNATTTGLFEGIAPGTYQVVAVDAVSCPVTTVVVVKSPDELVPAGIVLNAISCNSGTDGAISVKVTGGTAPYQYNWETGASDSIITNLPIGNYSVTVTDANGCTGATSVELTEADALALLPVGDTLKCFGNTDGVASVVPSGGNGPYTYLWDSLANSSLDPLVSELVAGTYSVTVTDVNGCTAETLVPIIEPDATNLTTGYKPPRCFTSGNGKAFVNVQGGVKPYTYKWNDIGNQVTDTAYNVKAGNYRVIVTDGNGCKDTAYAAVIPPDSISVAILSQPVSCNNTTDGVITLTPSGGTAPFTYGWFDNTFADSIRTNLSSGSYAVTLTDANNCKKVINPEVIAPPPIELEIITNPVNCFQGTDGAAQVAATGGTGFLSYQWSASNDSTNQITGLEPGDYAVTVTDENGCSQSEPFSLAQPDPIVLEASITDAACYGGNSGIASIQPTGGAGGWVFNWSTGDDSAEAANLSAGTYYVTVLDANNCPALDTVLVGQPTALLNAFSLASVSCNGGNDGEAIAMPVGGTPPYAITWSNGQTGTASDSWNAGTYAVSILDSKNCLLIDSFEITEPEILEVSTSAVTPVSCNNGSNGGITLVVTGGTLPYAYTWSQSGIGNTPVASNLVADTYQVTVTDAKGCTATLEAEITQPTALVSSFSVVDATCFGESSGGADVEVTGGSTPYSYQWSNNDTGQDLIDVPAGAYSLTITDSKGCTSTLNLNIDQPPALEVQLAIQEVKCFGNSDGVITATVTGGVEPYQFAWSGPGGFFSASPDLANLLAGTYGLVITDANGCMYVDSGVEVGQPDEAVTTQIPVPDKICEDTQDGTATVSVQGGTGPYTYLWSNGQTTATATGLGEGLFAVTVTDSQNCSWEDEVEIISYGQMTSELTQIPALCHGGEDGQAAVEMVSYDGVSQPLVDFTYQWNTQPVQSGSSAIGLVADKTYSVTITNEAGCTTTNSLTIGNPEQLLIGITAFENVSCFGGSDGTALAEGAGGTGVLNYFWGSNAGSVTTPNASGLAAGSYSVTVVDENNCQATTTVQINQPEALTLLDYQVRDVACFGEATGAISVNIQGGVSPYAYSWNNGDSGLAITDLNAGNYLLTVTDKNGCTFTWSQSIVQPSSPVTGTLEAQPVSCFGMQDGRVTIQVAGGTPPFQYSLDGSNYNGSSVQIGLEAGDYPAVFVKDSKGCVYFIGGITVDSPEPVAVDLGPDVELEFGDSTLLIPDIFFAVEPISFFWNPSDTGCYDPVDCRSLEVSPEYTSQVFLEIMDDRGCRAEDDIIIYVRQTRGVYVPTAFTPNGDDTNNILTVRGRPGIQINVFRVFDRWGEQVFEASSFEVNDPAFGWDGNFRSKEMPTGVYVWYVEAAYPDGFVEIYKGSTQILR